MRLRLVLAMFVLAALGAASLAVPAVRLKLAAVGDRARAAAGVPADSGPQTTAQKAPPWPIMRVPQSGVTAPTGMDFFGWSLWDRKTGQPIGHSDNADTATNYTESMIKAWIAADFLSRTVAAGKAPSQKDLTDLRDMIIHSNDKIADHYYGLDGKDAVIKRLNNACGTHATIHESGHWSYTNMTPDDAARYGLCLGNGKAAGKYTDQLLGWMREVEGGVNEQVHNPSVHVGGGRWGIIDGLPPELVSEASIKNGWEPENDTHDWNINCLAITHDYVLTVMVRYPWTASNIPPGTPWEKQFLYFDNLQPGADACKSVATQLVTVPES
jgi:hypothetical protein